MRMRLGERSSGAFTSMASGRVGDEKDEVLESSEAERLRLRAGIVALFSSVVMVVEGIKELERGEDGTEEWDRMLFVDGISLVNGLIGGGSLIDEWLLRGGLVKLAGAVARHGPRLRGQLQVGA